MLHEQIYNKHLPKMDWNSNLPYFNFGYQKCMFVSFLNKYIDPPNCIHYWVYSSYKLLKMQSNLY
jgi:hypothetical protein